MRRGAWSAILNMEMIRLKAGLRTLKTVEKVCSSGFSRFGEINVKPPITIGSLGVFALPFGRGRVSNYSVLNYSDH